MEETAPGKAMPERQVQPEGDVPQPEREKGKKTASSHVRFVVLPGGLARHPWHFAFLFLF